jgi:hypothetical protein
MALSNGSMKSVRRTCFALPPPLKCYGICQGVPTGLGLFLIDPHHRRTGTAVLDQRRALEAGLGPVIDIALARDVVGCHAVVRQVNDDVLPATTS